MDFIVTPAKSIDWKVERERVDLAAVMTRVLGPAAKKKNGRLWWKCRFHDDGSPSLFVKPGKKYWRCYGCDATGDAVDLVMKLERLTFPEAIAWILGESLPSRVPKPSSTPADSRRRPDPQSEQWQQTAREAAEAAERRLWTAEGAEALDYLHGRGLAEGTIRPARLGFIQAGRKGIPSGISIPWFDGPRLSMVNVRRPIGSDPKYVVFTGSRRGGIYPGAKTIKAGLPLAIVEGELDALLLGQELADLVVVVTLGSASSRPDPVILGRMLAASPWFIATDADDAGDKAAADWPSHARRVRPPGSYKDWTDAALDGVNLRRWWQDVLAGTERPRLFTWEELSSWKWGPGLTDPEPGIVV